MKKQENNIHLINRVYDGQEYKAEQALGLVWEQWGVISNHEQRIRKLENQLLDLKARLEKKVSQSNPLTK